jgi:hypothetical protein
VAHQNLLRLLTPLAKLWTGKLAVRVASETCEAFGGAGYLEDTGIPQLLRDAQVFPIWEGTTSVQALDLLRALQRGGGLATYLSAQRALLAQAQGEDVEPAVRAVREATTRLTEWLQRHAGAGTRLEAGARELALGLARCFGASLLLRHAAWSRSAEGDARAGAAARRFVAQGLVRFVDASETDARLLARDSDD